MNKQSRLDAAVMSEALLRRHVPGDSLCLSDEVLRSAIRGELALSAEQKQALKGSPLTLRRFRVLAEEQLRIQARTSPGEVSGEWAGSDGLLLAASAGSMSDALQTADEYWSLHFLRSVDGSLEVVLKLSPQAPFAGEFVSENGPTHRCVGVFDGEGGLLLHGALDADGELHVTWEYDVLPWVQITNAGGAFTVAPTA